MLAWQELARLEKALRATKVLSVYLDGRTRDPAQRGAWRRSLERMLAREREALAGAPRDEREAFRECVERLEASLLEYEGPPGNPGWVGFFPAGRDAHVESLPAEVPDLVAWDTGIRVAPYTRAREARPVAIVAVVDARLARLFRFTHGEPKHLETLRAHTTVGPVGHMGQPPRAGFHTGTRGSTGTDAAERELRAGSEAMYRELADRLESLAPDDDTWIFVGGIAESAAHAVRALPARVSDRARRLAGLDVHATSAQLAAVVSEALGAAIEERELVAVQSLVDRHAAGTKGAAGLHAVREALREQAVDTLYVSAEFLRRQPREAEEVVRATLDESGEVEHVSGTAAEWLDGRAEGVGARLRFVPARATVAAGAEAAAPGG